jgi:O-glycosyl hydrolase
MLEMEGKEENWQWFYHNKLKQNPGAMEQMDILAVHGYQDGVNPSSGSELGTMWSKHLTEFVQPHGKKAWMTETSGYGDDWENDGDTPGALGLAIDIQSAILHGDVSAWVYWQGSALAGIDEYNLMSDVTVGKKYYASKNFYRFVRPGAVRVSAAASDETVSVSAFEHEGNGTQTLVLINTADEARGIELAVQGGAPEDEYEMFVTSATQNCASAGTVQGDGTIVLPARSVVTLHAGGSDLGD